MIETKIDRNIPMPPKSRAPAWPWPEMEIGDSFLFPNGERYAHQKAYYEGLRTGRTYAVRKMGDVYRCWRIA